MPFLLVVASCAQSSNTASAKQQVLWQKLEASIAEVDRGLDGVMGVAIEDLTTGQKYGLRGDDVFPQASSIKARLAQEEILRKRRQQSDGGFRHAT